MCSTYILCNTNILPEVWTTSIHSNVLFISSYIDKNCNELLNNRSYRNFIVTIKMHNFCVIVKKQAWMLCLILQFCYDYCICTHTVKLLQPKEPSITVTVITYCMVECKKSMFCTRTCKCMDEFSQLLCILLWIGSTTLLFMTMLCVFVLAMSMQMCTHLYTYKNSIGCAIKVCFV